MSPKKDINRIESVRNAATGYVAVALGVICFLLVLAVIMAVVRFVAGAGLASSTSTASGTPASVTVGKTGTS